MSTQGNKIPQPDLAPFERAKLLDEATKERFKEARDEIADEIDAYLTTPRVDTLESSVELNLIYPITELENEYKKDRNDYEQGRIDYETLQARTESLTTELNRRKELIGGIISRKKGQTDVMSPTLLAEIAEHADEVAGIYRNLSPELREAVLHFFEAKSEPLTPEMRAKVFRQMIGAFLEDTTFENATSQVLWLTVFTMPEADREAFIGLGTKTIKALEPQSLDRFIKAGVSQGVIMPEDAEKMLYATLAPEEKEELVRKWQNGRFGKETADYVRKHSYGAENAADKMFTLKNIAILVGKTSAIGTFFANTAASFFNRGALLSPKQIVKNLFTNIYLPTSALGYVALDAWQDPGKRMIDALASEDPSTTLKKAEKELVQFDTTHKDFLVNGGAAALHGLRHKYTIDGKFQPELITHNALKLYLEAQAALPLAARDSQTAEYTKLIRYVEQNPEIQARDTVLGILDTFATLNIAGAEITTNYDKALQEAKTNLHI